MPRKGKSRPSEGEQAEEYGQSKEIVRYMAPYIPQHLVRSIGEYFRILGGDVQVDNLERTNGVFTYFHDKSSIHVTGGEFGSGLAVHFLTGLPKFVFTDRAIKILKKRVLKISKLGKEGYLDVKRGDGDHYGDMIAMAKEKDDEGNEIDTSNEPWVMNELEKITKILGHQKPKRRGGKRR